MASPPALPLHVPRHVRALVLAFGFAAACSSCGPVAPADAPGRGATVRVATWNVHDLFDAEDRLVAPGAEDTVLTPAEAAEKLARVAAVLARLDADVVLLQEVENAALLAELAARAGYPHHRLVEALDPRGIDVAALSRFPIARYASHLGELGADGRWLWSRDCVEVHLEGLPRPLVLVGSHLVSRLSDDGTRRAEQAAAMRAIADAVARDDPAALVVAGGDLNDPPDAEAIRPFAGDGAWFDPGAAAAEWTWSGRGTTARLDALLVRRADAPSVLRQAVASGADVAAASDHRPVVLDLWVAR